MRLTAPRLIQQRNDTAISSSILVYKHNLVVTSWDCLNVSSVFLAVLLHFVPRNWICSTCCINCMQKILPLQTVFHIQTFQRFKTALLCRKICCIQSILKEFFFFNVQEIMIHNKACSLHVTQSSFDSVETIAKMFWSSTECVKSPGRCFPVILQKLYRIEVKLSKCHKSTIPALFVPLQ